MKRARSHTDVFSRREFLRGSVAAAGLVGLGLAQTTPGAEKGGKNPFAYDVSRLSKTDPKLIAYEQRHRFASPHPEPKRITVGPDDRVYVASGNYVSVLDERGAILHDMALGEPARCLTVGEDGEIWVGVKDHVEVFDRSGKRQSTWKSPGPRTWLTGIALAKDHVFVADAGNRIVWRYDRSGKLLGRIGEKNKDRNIPGFIVPKPVFRCGNARGRPAPRFEPRAPSRGSVYG
jgi:hypothetical protein